MADVPNMAGQEQADFARRRRGRRADRQPGYVSDYKRGWVDKPDALYGVWAHIGHLIRKGIDTPDGLREGIGSARQRAGLEFTLTAMATAGIIERDGDVCRLTPAGLDKLERSR